MRNDLAAASLLLGCLLACKQKQAPPPPVLHEPGPAPASSGPCPTGRSEDPGSGEMNPAVTAFREKDYKTAQKLLETLGKKYPRSASVKVWEGDSFLFEKGVKDTVAADAALPLYDQALALHEAGCGLPPVEHYYLRLGMASAHLRKKDAAAAQKHTSVMVREWPNSAQSFYWHARTQCALGELTACGDSLEKCFTVAKRLQRPPFLRTHYSLDDWLRMASTQGEFAKLRASTRYREMVKAARE